MTISSNTPASPCYPPSDPFRNHLQDVVATFPVVNLPGLQETLDTLLEGVASSHEGDIDDSLLDGAEIVASIPCEVHLLELDPLLLLTPDEVPNGFGLAEVGSAVGTAMS